VTVPDSMPWAANSILVVYYRLYYTVPCCSIPCPVAVQCTRSLRFSAWGVHVSSTVGDWTMTTVGRIS